MRGLAGSRRRRRSRSRRWPWQLNGTIADSCSNCRRRFRRTSPGDNSKGKPMVRVFSLLFLAAAAMTGADPIRLHPENPHYFLFRGKPTVLITSGEHYGAILNLEFDYKRYLRTLAADRLNLTRTFAGSYREAPGSFGISENTLAPKPDRFIAPWARTDTPGAADGLEKFDLRRWNDAYFARLKDFAREAGARG